MTRHPYIEGSSFYLRGLQDSDLVGPYSQWFNDREVCQFNSHGRLPMTTAKLESFLKHSQTSQNDLVLAIVVKDGDRHVGNISLQRIQWLDRSGEYAILLGDRNFWGKGIAKEASLLLLKHAFLTLNLHRVYCGTSEANLPMQKLAAAMGMEMEGRRRQAIFKEGQYFDILEYGILQNEYSLKFSEAP